jgi:hypothetical protein
MSTKIGGFDLTDLTGDSGSAALIIVMLGLAGYVLVGGFWNGFYGHILASTGYDVSSNVTIMLTVLNTTCNTFNNIPNGQQSASLCTQSYNGIQSAVSLSDFFATILPILLFIIAMVILSSELVTDSVGAIIVGLIIALILSFVLNSIGYAIGFGLLGGNATIPVHTTSTTMTTTLSTTSTSTSTSTSSTTTIIYKGTCNALGGFSCNNASLSQESKLSVTIGQEILPTMYHIQIGCGTTTQANGFPNAQFYNETFNLTKGQFKQIDNLTCTGAQNGTFSGYIWMNYTGMSGKPNPLNNSFYENKTASVNIP